MPLDPSPAADGPARSSTGRRWRFWTKSWPATLAISSTARASRRFASWILKMDSSFGKLMTNQPSTLWGTFACGLPKRRTSKRCPLAFQEYVSNNLDSLTNDLSSRGLPVLESFAPAVRTAPPTAVPTVAPSQAEITEIPSSPTRRAGTVPPTTAPSGPNSPLLVASSPPSPTSGGTLPVIRQGCAVLILTYVVAVCKNHLLMDVSCANVRQTYRADCAVLEG